MEVVLTCYVIHNHIIEVDPTNYIMEAAMNQVESSDRELETHSHRTSLKKVECGMLREMRYAKPCGLIIPGVESSTLNTYDSDFYSCNM